jgi:hypothetical protein
VYVRTFSWMYGPTWTTPQSTITIPSSVTSELEFAIVGTLNVRGATSVGSPPPKKPRCCTAATTLG